MLHFIDVSWSVNVGAVLSRIVISALWLQQRFRSCQPKLMFLHETPPGNHSDTGAASTNVAFNCFDRWLFHWLHRQSLLLFYRKYSCTCIDGNVSWGKMLEQFGHYLMCNWLSIMCICNTHLQFLLKEYWTTVQLVPATTVFIVKVRAPAHYHIRKVKFAAELKVSVPVGGLLYLNSCVYPLCLP
jgi:hypothetical protein